MTSHLSYKREQIWVYTEVMLWILLLALLRKKQQNSDFLNGDIIISLENNYASEKNIVRYDFERKVIQFENIYNKQLKEFLNNDISQLKWDDPPLIASQSNPSLFLKKPVKGKNLAQRAKSKVEDTKKFFYFLLQKKFEQHEIGYIFKELNYAEVADKKTKIEPYTSFIKVPLPNLTKQSIQEYITKICGVGGKLEEYILLKKQKSTQSNLYLDPEHKKDMIKWIDYVSRCQIRLCPEQAWKDQHTQKFKEKWQHEYEKPYSPDINEVFNILVTDNIAEKNLALCSYLYNFLRIMYEKKIYWNSEPCPRLKDYCSMNATLA